jgi:hypothetical protein
MIMFTCMDIANPSCDVTKIALNTTKISKLVRFHSFRSFLLEIRELQTIVTSSAFKSNICIYITFKQ